MYIECKIERDDLITRSTLNGKAKGMVSGTLQGLRQIGDRKNRGRCSLLDSGLILLEPGTPGEPEVEAGGVGSSVGGRIARSAIVGQPVASGSATCTSACSGVRT